MQEEEDAQAEEDRLPADFLPLPGRGGITAAPREVENRVRLRRKENAPRQRRRAVRPNRQRVDERQRCQRIQQGRIRLHRLPPGNYRR